MKLKGMLVVSLLLTLFFTVQAEDYVYTESANKIYITGYTGAGGAVNIPSTINGFPVTLIDSAAFAGNTNITSVTIGTNVTTIGWYAFNDCSVLTNVTISRSVTSILGEAFLYCQNLRVISVDDGNSYYSSTNGVLLNKSKTMLIQCPGGKAGSFTIPDSVTNVEARAFYQCYNITNVMIGSGVTSIGDEAFKSSTNLSSITIGNSVNSIGMSAFMYCYSLTNAVIGNGVTNLGNGGTFYQCSNLTSVTIGANVTSIGGSTFKRCSSLKNVTIPDSVTSIGNEAFQSCYSLTNAVIGNNVTSIGYDTFFFCTSLAGITIPDSVTFIGYEAFCFCTSAVSVAIGNGVTNIEDAAFSSCDSLTNVTIGSRVASIGEEAFYGCDSLTSVTIPNSVTSIGYCAFGNCTRLANVTLGSGVTCVGEEAFIGTSLASVTIPDNVRSIGSSAFWFCAKLTSAMIGSGVTNIGLSAFGYCTNLTGVYFQGDAPAVSSNLFGAASSLPVVYRRSGASGWPTIPAPWSGRPTALWSPGSSYFLTVTGGTGGGSYTNGQKVTITAIVPVGMKFERWSGATQCLASVTSSTTVVTMPPNAASFTAVLKDLQNPVLTLNSPLTGARLTNAAVTVTGKATDNSGAVNVLLQLNNSAWATNNALLRTTNWIASLTLQPGSNSVKVCARDATGNSSVTNMLNLTCVVCGTLTIQTNGLGTVTRAPTGAPEVGATYTLTATPGTGFGFANWTGDVTPSTNKANTFTMTTNKAVIANFVDIQKPTVAITLPTAALRVSNSVYTVKGTATDNGVVTGVFCRVNSGFWTNAFTTNAWKNWSVPLALTAGSNLVQVYSMDKTGNISATSSVSCTYVVLGTLTVTTNGVGTVTRAPATPPEVNQKYTLTAVAETGSVFSNWTGDVTSTNKVITFTMTSNTAICATFTDTAKPTIAITTPTALQRIVTNGLIAVRGNAVDNKAVSNVLVQVNGGGWTDAATTNGWKNWNAEVTVSARTNTIRAYSMDTTGNCSTTSSVTFIYVEMGNLTIQTNGQGSVTRTPATTPELGVKYTMTATPKAGSVFTNWTYGIGGHVATNKPAITFTMPSNLVLTANFTDIAKPTVTITLPTANLRVTNTNPVYTVKGTATDNSAVATVKVRLNSGDWTNAVTTNAWKSWSVPVTLVTGTNTVRAYSIDTTGNNSSTTTVACIYPVVTIDVAAYANLSVGGRWNYKQTEGRDIETRALEVIETTIKNGHPVYLIQEYTDWGSPDDQFFWSSDFSAGLFDTGGLNDNGQPTETTFYWQPFMPKLLKTFVPGADITTKCTRSDMTGFITGKGKAVRERVTVPAGTYDCWKVAGTATFNGQVSSDTSWYAENVGLVKRLQDGSLWELTSYVPPATSVPMEIPSSEQPTVAPASTPQAAITVDGYSKDWTDIPRSAFSYASVTQEVAVALDGNNIALLLNGCPFSTSDTVLVYFKLRLTYGEGDDRHTVDLWTSGSVLYGMVDGQVITGLEAVLLDGVLEVKIPVERAPSQVTIEEVGCGMDLGGGTLMEVFKVIPF